MPVEMNDIFEKVAAYLSGEMTAEETRRFNDWRQANPDNERVFREAELIWKHSPPRLEYSGDRDTDWNDLETRMEVEKEVPFWQNNWYRAAAAFLVIAIAATWLMIKPAEEQLASITVYKSAGAVETITLPDSTTVWLNQNSSVEVLADFGSSTRSVVLQGEAYFKVTRNDSVPFIVLTGNASTQVLGTAFNIITRNDSTRLEVAEGKVSFAPRGTNVVALELTKNEGAAIAAESGPEKFQTDARSIGAWRKKNNAKFDLEKKTPALFIVPEYTSSKNSINQSVIRGVIRSKATVANYRSILLNVRYTKANGKVVHTSFRVEGPLNAGGEIRFEKRLLDLFSDSHDLRVEPASAEVF